MLININASTDLWVFNSFIPGNGIQQKRKRLSLRRHHRSLVRSRRILGDQLQAEEADHGGGSGGRRLRERGERASGREIQRHNVSGEIQRHNVSGEIQRHNVSGEIQRHNVSGKIQRHNLSGN